jgi:predicted porin
MKKSLIALAALATVATAAQAQSSVTVYGVLDAGVTQVSNTTGVAAVTGLTNGGLSTPRIGFRGVEDLGGGLKAGFTLEAEFLVDNGSQGSTAEALFARESSVSLSANAGEVKLGRFNAFGYGLLAKFDGLGGNNIGGAVATGNRQARIENAIQYTTPKVNGLQAGVQTGTRTSSTTATYGEVAGSTSGNRASGLFVSYDQGPLELAVTYGDERDYRGDKYKDYTSAFARYDFGVVKVVLGGVKQDIARETASASTTASSNTSETSTWASGDTRKTEKVFLGVNAPISGTKLTVNGQVEQIKYTLEGGATRKPVVYTAGLNYALSKRTTAYAIYAVAKDDNGSSQDIVDSGKLSGFSGSYAGADKQAASIGIRHTF